LRVVVTVRDTATRDVDETMSIDNQPRKLRYLPGCPFLNALIIPLRSEECLPPLDTFLRSVIEL
jgi:hypothetical protein